MRKNERTQERRWIHLPIASQLQTTDKNQRSFTPSPIFLSAVKRPPGSFDFEIDQLLTETLATTTLDGFQTDRAASTEASSEVTTASDDHDEALKRLKTQNGLEWTFGTVQKQKFNKLIWGIRPLIAGIGPKDDEPRVVYQPYKAFLIELSIQDIFEWTSSFVWTTKWFLLFWALRRGFSKGATSLAEVMKTKPWFRLGNRPNSKQIPGIVS